MDRLARIMGAALVAAWVCAPSSAQAQIWTEVGGTHNTAATAQTVTLAGFNQINGSFSSSNELDVYRFTVTSPATFSATTAGGNTSPTTDTMLFLFTNTGVGIAMNDDIQNNKNNPVDPRSMLPAGNAMYASLAPAQYLLAVGLYNNRPTSSSPAGTIFTNDAEGVFGPQDNGVFNGETSGSSLPAAQYSIMLTGVSAVPEPGTLLLTGIAGIGYFARRRRQRAA